MGELTTTMADTLKELVQAIKDVSPEVWDAAMRQTQAQLHVAEFWTTVGWWVLGVGVVMFLGGIALAIVTGTEESFGMSGFALIPLVVGLIILSVNYPITVELAYSPEWNAIKLIGGLR